MRELNIKWSKIYGYNEGNDYFVPENSGVYEILIKNKNSKYDRTYIGETDNLKRRFNEHLSSLEENENIKLGLEQYQCVFNFALINNENNRLDAEQGLYQKYTYSWNQEEPAGSGVGQYRIVESE